MEIREGDAREIAQAHMALEEVNLTFGHIVTV